MGGAHERLRVPDDAALDRLAERLGPGRLLRTPEGRARYSRDESTLLEAEPWAVALPRSDGEVCEVLRWASDGPFAVVPRGTGTGVAGGAVALGGGVVLALEALSRVLEVDEENLTLTCEPGVVTARVHEEAERRGLFYPPDPASLDSCSIGGNVAVGAGGARALKYGTTRDYVLAATVALADGTLLRLGSKNVKDASGFALLELLVGSEGTLGVITEVTLRLVPLPARRVCLLLPFADLEACSRAVVGLLRERITPSVAEFMDDVTIEAAAGYLARELPPAGAYALVELDGNDPAALQLEMLRVDEIARREGCRESLAAEDPGQQERLWEVRRCIARALKARSPEIGKADVVVPRARVPELVRRVKALGARLGITAACFGHAGDGNIHVNFLRGGLSGAEWSQVRALAMDELMTETRALGGLPSGEHGIGVLKKAHLARFLAPEGLELMRRIKACFDPQGLLNPGKVV